VFVDCSAVERTARGNLHWFANGQEVKEAAGQTTVTVSASAITSGSYKIYAVVVYNDCAVASNACSA
jgi:membrane carboxypeptidase/penicillin-binding protein PbpC